eukprot:jgi/Undpi1/11663/HiC_scaffold_36.g13958.m1
MMDQHRCARRVGWMLGQLVLALRCATTISVATPPVFAVQMDTGHPHAVQRAEFALGELQALSDTGIYRTLSLKRISSAATRDGVFHDNTLLTLDLASPYFKSGRKDERFKVVVMEHKEDGHISFSIDSFPQMDSKAVEDFHIQKVERHRQRRAAFFSELERESEGDARAMAMEGTSDPARLAVNMMAHDTHRLQAILDGVEAIAIADGLPQEDPLQTAVAFELKRRLEQSSL